MRTPTEEHRKELFCNAYNIQCQYYFKSIEEKVDRIIVSIDNLNKTVIGNGDSRHSLVLENTLNSQFRKQMERWFWVLVVASTSGFIALFWKAAEATILK